MGKKKRKDLIEENLTNTDVTNTDVGFGEMAIQQTITNCSDIGKNTRVSPTTLSKITRRGRNPQNSKEQAVPRPSEAPQTPEIPVTTP